MHVTPLKAYIETNLFGFAFCNAAWEAFKTLMGNFVQVAASNFVGVLVFFTLKMLVVSANLIIAYYWMKATFEAETDSVAAAEASSEFSSVASGASGSGSDVARMRRDDAAASETGSLSTVSYAAPMLIIALGTYFVVGAFTELFEMTTDTILICFCEDKEHNKGDEGKLLAPKSLLSALGMYKKNETDKKTAAEESKLAETAMY